MTVSTGWQQRAWMLFPLVACFACLGTRGLNEPDEGRYAEIGREMAETGEWLVPHLNGFEHFQKPPLLYWCTTLSVCVFGVNEWAARLPSALAALGVVAMTFLIGRKLAGREQGIVASVVVTASAGFFALARMLTPDMLLTFWITAAVATFVHERPWWFFICMGLGFLTKGPMALIVPLCAALGWQWCARGGADKRRIPWMRGLALTLLLGLSWFIALSVRQPALFDYFWRDELVNRFGSAMHGRAQPFWFFVPVLLVALLPWSVLLLENAATVVRRLRRGNFTPEQGLLLGWVMPPFVILSLSGSKLPTYVLPLMPAFAVMVARMVFTERTRRVWHWALPALACWLAALFVLDRSGHLLEQQASMRPLADVLKAQPDLPKARIFACGVRAHGLEFYLQRLVSVTRAEADVVLPTTPAQEERLMETPHDGAAWFSSGGPAYAIVRQDRMEQTFSVLGWRVLARSGDFVLTGNRETAAVMKQ